MKPSPTTAWLLDRTVHPTLPPWILATAIIGAGLMCLAVASHERGAVAAIAQIRNAPVVNTIVPVSVETANTAAGPSTARPPLPASSEAGFRFGFLEFEDDPDASAE